MREFQRLTHEGHRRSPGNDALPLSRDTPQEDFTPLFAVSHLREGSLPLALQLRGHRTFIVSLIPLPRSSCCTLTFALIWSKVQEKLVFSPSASSSQQ